MSTVPTPQRRLTPEEYLAIERAAEFKSEFYHGRMLAMAGANERHNLIAGNLFALLRSALRAKGCQTYIADMKVSVHRGEIFTYPDVVAACGEIEFADEARTVLLNPTIIVEVQSKSTERHDRGWKFHNYFNIPSLVDYLLVSQDKPFIEHFVRRPDGTRMFEFVEGLDATLKLSAIDLSIPLREIYLDMQFGPDEEDESLPTDGVVR